MNKEMRESGTINSAKSIHILKTGYFPFILIAVTILLFINTFGGEFVFDDYTVVVNNPEIRYWHFWDIWAWWGRSTRTLSLMIDYYLFGDAPFGYHFQNILWHLTSILLLYLLFIKLSNDHLLSFLSVLFFAVHPIHVEVVANIANRKEAICMTFSLISIISYIRFAEEASGKKWPWLFGSLLSWYLALNSKQVAIVLPLSIVFYELLLAAPGKRFLTKKPVLLWIYLIVGGIFLSYYVLQSVQFTKGSYIGNLSMFSALLASGMAFLKFIQLLIVPMDLLPDYAIKLSESIADPLVILSWSATVGVILLPFYLIRRAPLVSFGMFWFLIHYIPVSGITPDTHFVADRYMYIPSAGFCLAMVSAGRMGFNELLKRYDRKIAIRVTSIAVMVGVTLYSAKTVTYNFIWLKEKRLWEYTLKINPESVRAYHALGVLSEESGNYQQAIKNYSRAIDINPQYEKAWNNRGVTYANSGNYQQSLRDFQRAIELNPKYSNAYLGRGTTYYNIGNYKQAIKAHTRAIELDPKNSVAFNQRGIDYYSTGSNDQAIKDYDRAIILNPQYADAYNNRGNVYNSLSKYQRAIMDYNKAVKIDSQYSDAYFNRGVASVDKGNYRQAIDDFLKVIELQPEDGETYYNLGLAYKQFGDADQASFYLKKASDLGFASGQLL